MSRQNRPAPADQGRAFEHIVLRDIKPSNVLVAERGAPVLTDFGIATTFERRAHLTATGMTLGSIEYMSSEQAAGDRVDERADL